VVGLQEAEARLQIYLTHRRALVDYATPIVGSRAHAEDVVQEAYIRFVPPDGPSPGVRQPASYLYRVVRNLALDLVRGFAAESRRDAAYAEATGPVPLAPSPEEELFHRDELGRVSTALAELPDDKRAAFEMNRLGGLPFHEIARHLGVSPATAHRNAQDALVHIMHRLQAPKG
jgi:RNA polymerase sigma-70 factor (ECF subfamily)